MEISDFYMTLPYDLSGARSKNRFCIELLWGISKMLDIYDEDDFTIVFDYFCDIEIHCKDKLEFYQLKSHMGIKKYIINDLTNPGKKKNSILGKLFILEKDNEMNIKLAIISNGYLRDNSIIKEEFKEIELNDLSEKSKTKIKDLIQTELKLDEVNLSAVFFIHIDMNLKDPGSEIKGKLITKFEKIKGCEPKKPNALYRFIYDTVRQKACYEFSCEDYDKMLSLKGMSKADFERILNLFVDNIDKSVELTKTYIEFLKGI